MIVGIIQALIVTILTVTYIISFDWLIGLMLIGSLIVLIHLGVQE